MSDYTKMHEQVNRLREMLHLFLNPQAIKMVEDESEVPANAIRPKRDLGKHLALCQAFAMTKRTGKTLYITKEDHWCWNPLIAFGCVKCEPDDEDFDVITQHIGIPDHEAAKKFVAEFSKLPYGKYKGILVAPAQEAEFEPDVILVNCDNNFQLRAMLWGIKSATGKMVTCSFEALDSCVHSTVDVMKEGEYRITFPDPGDQERALAGPNEVILSIPKGRLDELMRGMEYIESRGMGYRGMKTEMMLDFPRPPFYNKLYSLWGLDQGEDWEH